ncbi:hypothetical protein ASPCADRAFT_44891 [Aspergillus carbonarius ITEM 5010]|nr:hypothetical protein ASPCADRAFT_44891 [Aspergillus carbonarius ITEM 5010]
MRSFFNKPSWASRGAEQADLDFYRHAGQVYNDIITANQKARIGRLSAEKDTPKRRRLSSIQAPDISISKPINNGEMSRSAEQSLNIGAGCCDDSQEKMNSNSHQSRTTSIDISAATAKKANVQSCESSRDVKLIHIETSAVASQLAEGINVNTKAPVKGSCRQDAQEIIENAVAHNHHLAHEKAIVQILITSKIPNTKPLIVRRRMHQPLKDVRLAWCNRQQLSREKQASVFLTWKGKRLFDVTTCRSLGIQTNRGSFVGLEYDPFEVDGEDIQVHMEAATEESLGNILRHLPTVIDSESTSDPAGFTGRSSSADKVILKCPGFGDLKVTFSLEMQVSQLVVAFRDAKQIPAGREVFLVFDGDRLDPFLSLADYELINNDLIDVIIK